MDPAAEKKPAKLADKLVDLIREQFSLGNLVAQGLEPVTEVVTLANRVLTIGEYLLTIKQRQREALAKYVADLAELLDKLAAALSGGQSRRDTMRLCEELRIHAKELAQRLSGVFADERGREIIDLLQSETMGDRAFYVEKFPTLNADEQQKVLDGLAVAAGTFTALGKVLSSPDLPRAQSQKPRDPSSDDDAAPPSASAESAQAIAQAYAKAAMGGAKRLWDWSESAARLMGLEKFTPAASAFQELVLKSILESKAKIKQVSDRPPVELSAVDKNNDATNENARR